jgi:hypothetical protein
MQFDVHSIGWLRILRSSEEKSVPTLLRAVLNRAVDCFFGRSRLVKFKNHSYPPFFRFEMTARLANRHN